MDSNVKVECGGTLVWRNKRGQVHREGDKPAVILPNGSQEWAIEDLLWREDNKPFKVCPG